MAFGDPVTSIAIGGAAAFLAMIVFVFTRPKISCGACGADLPRFRLPRSGAQAALGGFTCPNCGTELDAKGHPREGGQD